MNKPRGIHPIDSREEKLPRSEKHHASHIARIVRELYGPQEVVINLNDHTDKILRALSCHESDPTTIEGTSFYPEGLSEDDDLGAQDGRISSIVIPRPGTSFP